MHILVRLVKTIFMRRNHRVAVRVYGDCAAVCFYVPVFSLTEDFIGGFSVVFARFFIFNVFCRGKNCVFAPTNNIIGHKSKIPFYADNTEFRCVKFFKIF